MSRKKLLFQLLDFSTLYITNPHKVLLKLLSEINDYVFKLKSENALAFLKHLYIGLVRELEEMFCLFS